MEREDIKKRIDEITTLINRDAGYTVPHIRVVAEQTLALWAVAEQITESNVSLFEIANRLAALERVALTNIATDAEIVAKLTQLELTLRGGFKQITEGQR